MTSILCIVLGMTLTVEQGVRITEMPKEVPPRFGIAVLDDKGGVEIRYLDTTAVWHPHTVQKFSPSTGDENEKREWGTYEYKTHGYELKPEVENRPAGKFQVYRNGEKLDQKTSEGLLKQSRRVVFWENPNFGDWPNETFLDLLAADTVLVVLPVRETPQVKIEPKPAVPPVLGPPQELPWWKRGSGGKYWEEELYVWNKEETNPKRVGTPHPLLNTKLGVAFVELCKRPDIEPKGWNGPRLMDHGNGGGELTFFGHRTEDGPKGVAQLIYGEAENDWKNVPTYLSVADAKTKPRLILTDDAKKGVRWRMIEEKTWKVNKDPKDGPLETHVVGFVQLDGDPDVELYLSLAAESILQIDQNQKNREARETTEFRLLMVSPAKETQFHYVRSYTGGR